MSADDGKSQADVLSFQGSFTAFGSEVRQLRRAREMTLKAISEASGISVSYLSAIERGASNPSIDVVQRIAKALSVSPAWFFSRRPGKGPNEQAFVVRRQNRRNLNVLYGETVEEAGYSDALLSSSIGGNIFMGIADYEPQSDKPQDQLYQHGGELHGYILQGELELVIGEEVITMRQGDSYSFPASVIHTIRNVTDQPARLIWANGPVIIPSDVVARPGADVPNQDTRKKQKND